MSSVRCLANLHCARCGEVTLHSANVCQQRDCGHINRDSGNPPVARPRAYGYGAMKAKHYDHEATRRARRARHQVIARIRA
jgi:hypothetical protein